MDAIVKRTETTPFEMPFREIPDQYMSWMRPQWRYFELVELELESGEIGYGETMLFYTWGKSTEEDAQRARGRNAAELLWDDSLGSGIQMALFDAVGRKLGVPIHSLLGQQVREQVPLSWWATDMRGEDWVSECKVAIDHGYQNIKLKGRPWWDLRDAVTQLSAEIPSSVDIDLDFNGTLIDAERAIPLLKGLTDYPQISVIETPIPQDDIVGNKSIRDAVDVDLAMHYGTPPVFDQTPPPLAALKYDVCDGFVLTGGCTQMIREGAVASMAGKPLWLQLVGTGVTAAFTLHLGAVIEGATWPAVTCHELHSISVLNDPVEVKDGHSKVPDGPGLGVRPNLDIINERQIEKSDANPDPPRLIKTDIPGGEDLYFANYEPQMKESARNGEFPYFPSGIDTRVIPDDGSDRWQQLHDKATESPPVIE